MDSFLDQTLKGRLQNQDNRATKDPIFVVEQATRIYGLETGYEDGYVWLTTDGEGGEADDRQAAVLENWEDAFEEEPPNWQKVNYKDVWTFVTCCFTEQGCKDYLAVNGHNIGDYRIFAYSSYRNQEWKHIREFLMSDKGAGD